MVIDEDDLFDGILGGRNLREDEKMDLPQLNFDCSHFTALEKGICRLLLLHPKASEEFPIDLHYLPILTIEQQKLLKRTIQNHLGITPLKDDDLD